MVIRFRGKVVVSTYSSTFHCNGFGDLGFPFYSFRSQHLYSSTATPDPTHFLVKYLVDSLGFSNQQANSISSKLTSRKTFKNPDLVINFLKQTGFDNTHMKKMVSTAPKLLFSDVSKTLKPKFQCLMDLGLSGSDLVNVIAKDSTIVIERGLDTHLRPTIDCLRRILGSDDNVLKAIKRTPWLLKFGACHTMETNLLLLKNFGVPDEGIKKLVLRNPRYFAQNPERIKDVLHRMENDFRLPLGSPNFLYGVLVLSQKKSKLDKKFEIFKSFGWYDEDILEMFRKVPQFVGFSEVRIQKALNLFMKELGFKTAYLVSHPTILVYNMEKRVVPRMQVLKILVEKKLEWRKLSLYKVMSLTEKKFIDYFVLPYKDQIPDLYEPLKKNVAPL